jgi:hypothetical protein
MTQLIRWLGGAISRAGALAFQEHPVGAGGWSSDARTISKASSRLQPHFEMEA